jgi:hypothetical protein
MFFFFYVSYLCPYVGRAVYQTVSYRLLTTEAWSQSQNGRYLSKHLPVIFPSIHCADMLPGSASDNPTWGSITNGLSLTRALELKLKKKKKKTKLRGSSPQVNYTDRPTAACRRSCANFCG